MTERFTVRLDEDAAEWVATEADARDRSKAWIIQEAVDAARGTDSVFTDAERTGVMRTDAHLTNRLDALEERLADLEADRDDSAAETAEDRAAGAADNAASEAPGSETAEPTSGVTDHTTPRATDDLFAGWEPGRDHEEREDRREIGRQVLEWFRETKGYVSAADVKAALYPELTYADESADTWWRKLGRPPLKAAVDAGLAEYRAGYHDYRWLGEAGDRDDAIDEEDGGSSSSDVYDPTEEF